MSSATIPLKKYESTEREKCLMRIHASLSALQHYIDYEKDKDPRCVDIRKRIAKDMIKELKSFK